jgi:hypothetical protein
MGWDRPALEKARTEKKRRKKKDGKRKTEKERPTLKIEGGAPSA